MRVTEFVMSRPSRRSVCRPPLWPGSGHHRGGARVLLELQEKRPNRPGKCHNMDNGGVSVTTWR